MVKQYPKKICVNCDSTVTNVGKRKNGNIYEKWYNYNGGYICHKCRSKLIDKPKWRPLHGKEWNDRRVNFVDKQIIVKENPRKGQCEYCGKKLGDIYINWLGKEAIVKKTDIHHIQYHPEDPLKDTIELCVSCHNKESWRLGHITSRWN